MAFTDKPQPVLIASAVTAFLRALLALFVIMEWVILSPDQIAAIVLAVELFFNIPLTIWARSQVTPTSTIPPPAEP